jgi:acyl-CoA reductase-like NAD-dependent aldehyde dehydrogenase
VCMALKRLYVPRSRYDEVIDGLKATLVNQKIGPGLDQATTMGPLNTAAQRDYVAKLLEQAKAAGAEVQSYGEYTGMRTSGNYMLPSLVLDPAPELAIVAEEQFGPALPVLPCDDEEQAIRLANAGWSGLCSSVWSGDTEHAMRVGRQLRTGVTFFNNHNATAVDERAPFGGFNQSGIGRELGREGLLSFTETHVMAVPSGPPAH